MPSRSLPAQCTFLTSGQAFVGTQNVSHSSSSVTIGDGGVIGSGVIGSGALSGGGAPAPKDEAWSVNVRVQGSNPQCGYVCGSMEALNVPSAESSVVTFWEGETVDNVNYTFFTHKWDADRDTDMKHWLRFDAFAPLHEAVLRDGGRSIDLASYPYLFMRWKEKFFVNVGAECGLTIAGFYYVCLSRRDGSVDGFYYDPNSSPYQKLELRPTAEGRRGHAFATYSLC